MKNVNIGIVNLIISNKLKESYFKNNLIKESKKITSDFFDIVKSSPVLQLEFKVFNNIEGKYIKNELLAKDYIDNNIKLFEIYTIEEIDVERAKLKKFINEEAIPVDNDKISLYEAIDNLITETLENNINVDVNKMHEAFSLIMEYIKIPKKELFENVNIKLINEDVIEIAVNKFNKKYDLLNENDKILLKKLIKSTDKEKEILLEIYKNENLEILKNVDNGKTKDNVKKAIQKINEMVYEKNNVDDNIIELHELKKELI